MGLMEGDNTPKDCPFEGQASGVAITAPKMAWWMLGAFATFVIAGGVAWMTSVNNDLREHARQESELRERVRAVETSITSILTGQDANARQLAAVLENVRSNADLIKKIEYIVGREHELENLRKERNDASRR